MITLQEIVYDGLLLSVTQRGNDSTFSLLASAASGCSQLYAISAIALFVCLGWLTSIVLEALVQDIQSYLNKSCADHLQLVVKWKRTHVLVCEFVQHINDCFGLVLLIFIAKQFICIINDAFVTIAAFRAMNRASVADVLSIMAITKNLFYLYMVTYVSEKIRNQVFITLSILLFDQ